MSVNWQTFRADATNDRKALRDARKHGPQEFVEEFERSALRHEQLAEAAHGRVLERQGELLELENLVREHARQLLHLVPKSNLFDPRPNDLADKLRDLTKLEGAISQLQKRQVGEEKANAGGRGGEARRHEAIRETLDALAAAVASRVVRLKKKPTGKKRPAHRPPDTDANADATIAQKWAAWREKGNPRSVSQFASDFGYGEAATRAVLDRHRKRPVKQI